jgi:hypothetical protein
MVFIIKPVSSSYMVEDTNQMHSKGEKMSENEAD